MADPALQLLIDRVKSAEAAGAQLCIRGGGTKDFYGEAPQGEPLDTRVLEGISSYEPTELVVLDDQRDFRRVVQCQHKEQHEQQNADDPDEKFHADSETGGGATAGNGAIAGLCRIVADSYGGQPRKAWRQTSIAGIKNAPASGAFLKLPSAT